MNRSRFTRGALVLLGACALNYLGDRLLGVRIELFWGLDTFSFLWFLDVFILPFVVGTAVGMVYGLGGKILCYFPPLLVRIYSYFEVLHITGVPEGASLLPLGWWGFFVILCIEASAVGGVVGELLIKRTYGRLPRHLVYKQKSDNPPPTKTEE
jgi:hypothetical protein